MKKTKKIILFLFIIIMASILFHFANNYIVSTKYVIHKKESKNNKLNIVQLSDLHNKEFGKSNSKLISRVKKLNPDVIFLTGDVVDANRTNIDVAIHTAEQLVTIAPVYYVSGNHECSLEYEDRAELEMKLEDAGVKVLYNETVSFNDHFEIIGLDDGSIDENSDVLKKLVEQCDSSKTTLLLSHEPQVFSWYVKSGVDVVFCGHAHGGQIRIPFLNIGFVAPDQGLFPKYTSGIFTSRNTSMVISRGLGNSILPLRIFNQPEIVKVTIQ